MIPVDTIQGIGRGIKESSGGGELCMIYLI
jgi:hypothetical protein